MTKEIVDHGTSCSITRRSFMQGIAALGVVAPFSRLALATGILEQNFVLPPDSARMWTWWFWLSDCVSTESITADLAAMKAQGIGGATVYSLSGHGLDTRHGPNYMSPAWRELFKHAAREATRLGLGMNTMLCSGWNAGGPWINPEHGCKRYTHTELTVAGPQKFHGELPQPACDARFYRDIAVRAFRVSPHAPSTIPDPAQVEARNTLVSFKNGTNSLGESGKVPIREICDASLKPLPPDPVGDTLDLASCIDLTGNCDETGTLDWAVPEGKWFVFRLGCTLTGKKTVWSSPTGEGLECDPFDSAAMDAEFQHTAGILLKDVGPALRSVEIDSWEIGLPNWTMNYLDAFRIYRGYDASPYLPALAGRTVGCAEISDRFLYDFRLTLGDLVADNYFGRLTTLAEEAGIFQQSEAGGLCSGKLMTMDALKNLGRCAVPMGEFWQDSSWQEDGQNVNGKQTACAAHLYGKKIAAAEAFPTWLQWTESPATLKPTSDRAFCEGFNFFEIQYTATRMDEGTPGTEFAAGTHFNRRVTWWNQARPFCDYIARCCYLLQQGLFAADVLFYNGDGCPNFVAPKHIDPSLGPGYDYDVCNTEILLTRLSVGNGRIVLPDGMSYQLMVLPDRKSMPLDVVQKVKELVKAGMTLVGPRPEQTPGLAAYPTCDQQLKEEANELWGNCDGSTVKEHRFGKGRVLWGVTPREILTQAGVAPDFEHDGNAETFLDWIHRSDGSREIYFVVNRKEHEESRTCTFRVSGQQPQILDPVTGAVHDASAFVQSGGRTSLPLEFAPFGSIFVIFGDKIPVTQDGVDRTKAEKLVPASTIAGPWTVRFDPEWGGPPSVQFPELVDWTQRPEESIKYYSGTATYSHTLILNPSRGQRVFLDLGEVKELAEVRLNGKKVGIVWTRPYRVEITSAVQAGENKLEIDVVNLWPNRMIGDGLLSLDKRSYTVTNISTYYDSSLCHKPQALLPSGLLGPVTVLAGS
jgi:hypothetical protein